MAETRPTVAVDLRALVPEATGIGVYTRELLRALVDRGGFSYLGLAHREPRGAGDLAALGVRLEHQSAPLGVLWQQLRLPRRLAPGRASGRRGGEVDLLWSPLQTLPARCPVPAVVTVHDLTVLLMPEAHRAKVRWSQVPFLERSLAAARRVVAVSEATAADLRFQFPEAFRDREKLRVIHHGVSPVFRPADDEERAAIRQELGFPNGYLLYAGTLEPRKNVEGVLDAWQALRDADPTAPPLVLAGGYGWRSRPLMRRIHRIQAADRAAGESRTLAALGRVDEETLARLYRAATVFLYPSFYEGFGMPVAEAMASGAPVITSDRSSLPEVAGEAALQVRPEDPAQILGALKKLLEDPALARELAHRGLERARTFRWEKAAAEMEQVFGEALE